MAAILLGESAGGKDGANFCREDMLDRYWVIIPAALYFVALSAPMDSLAFIILFDVVDSFVLRFMILSVFTSLPLMVLFGQS